jgi:SAM-dependent methyltransferase
MIKLTLEQVVGRVFTDDAYHLLRCQPDAFVDLIPADPMYGTTKHPTPRSYYGFGPDPCRGDPDRWAALHLPILRECHRVLRVGGVLAWAMSTGFRRHFPRWFGPHRLWALARHTYGTRAVYGHIWVVQRKTPGGMEPVRFPDADGFVDMLTPPKLLRLHPCPKNPGEMRFIIEHLSQPGDLVLDCFCGIGTTLVAAKELGRRYFGCDIWGPYCDKARERLKETQGLPKPLLKAHF